MDTIAAPTHGPVCRLCHESIGPDDSYRGYCFGCLLVPALDLDNPDEHDQNGWFDPYEILTHPDGSFVELGRGSMGISYKAIDTTLQFPVGLKVIDLKAAGLDSNRERFLREARAAAQLRHPHVASVLYYGVRKDGQCFYAMELVDGETLAERVQRQGRLPEKDALAVIAQVASALQAAERFGLVHRDLKPANIMLVSGPEINVKVIDFGLAKLMRAQEPADQITHNGFVGTPAFASPEQFSGEQIDQRSDYFSLGSTLYYLLTGTPPFKANRLNKLTEHAAGTAVPIDQLKALGITFPVRRLLSSLLSADPERRPRDGQTLTDAIAKCQREMAAGGTRKAPRLLAAISAILLAGAGVVYLTSGIIGRNTTPKSIAVLPFDNLSPMGDKAYFADGIQDDVLTNLAKIADLRVISRASVQQYRNPVGRPLPRQIGETLHVRYLLNGSIRREGDRIRVTAQLQEAESGRELWAERYDGQLTDIFTIQAELAEAISQQLQAKLSSAEKGSLEEIPTRDLASYELYLHAKELYANYYETTQGWEPLDSAVRLLNEAVARDPSFALAWCYLAKVHDCAYWLNEDQTDSRRALAESALQKALSLRPDLGEIHLAIGLHLMVTARDYAAARRELEIARQTLPNSAALFGTLAKIDSLEGRWFDAANYFQRESALDPKNFHSIVERCSLYQSHRQYDVVRKITGEAAVLGVNRQTIGLLNAEAAWQESGDTTAFHPLVDDPAGPLYTNARATLVKIHCALVDHNFQGAETILAADPSREFEGGTQRMICREFALGWIKKVSGEATTAKMAFASARPFQLEYVQKSPNDPNPLMMLAYTDAGLGNREAALSEARNAVAMRPVSQAAIESAQLRTDLAEMYVWVGERNLAIEQLEFLVEVPGALTYGDLAKMPEWDPLRSDPRFQKVLFRLKEPIPIVNRPE